MTRLLALAGVLAVAAVTAGLVTGCGGDGGNGGYVLRAVFDNASGLRTGMELRVSGITVGTVRSVTLDQSDPALPHAVAVMDVTDARMRDFRRDARCTVRAASLLGDRFVDCSPTVAARPGRPAAAPLRTVRADGETQHLLPVTRTSSPVDPDLVLDIFRLPVRQRLSIVINELGAGLAGNGPALRGAVHRADPALLQLDRVLGTVSQQRRALASLADSSEHVLEPLARERQHLAGFIQHGASLNAAVGARSAALRESFRRLPAFLRELRATMHDVDGLSATAGPALADLDGAARQLSAATKALAPAARTGTPALEALGDASTTQGRALVASEPLLEQLARLTPAAKPVAGDLGDTLASFERQGGIERLTDTPRALSLIANGYDRDGYFARANAIITSCASYVVTPLAACQAAYQEGAAASARSASARSASAGRRQAAVEPVLDYLLGATR